MKTSVAGQMRKHVGKQVYILRKDGRVLSGRLIRKNNRYMLQPKGKTAKTKAIIPLVLFDLLAVGTSPYFYGPYGQYSPYGSCGHYGGYGGYGSYGSYNPYIPYGSPYY